jgi:2-haloacid dehalogenase
MDRPTAVVFDIGNVFVEWDPRFLYEKLIPDPEELTYFLNEVVTLEWHSEHDRGRPFAEGVRLLSNKFPEYEDLINAFDTRWTETFGTAFQGTIDIMMSLVEQGMRVLGLTNFSAEKWPAFCVENSFTDHFEGVVVSGEERLIKPDPRVFQNLLSRFELDPERTIFIDDRHDNIVAAQQLDMIGHQFSEPTALARFLADHGLKV